MNKIILPVLFYLVFSQLVVAVPCPEVLRQLATSERSQVSSLYDQLQKTDAEGKTKLALQSDFDDLIHEGGGGACASATAFNLLQGLRMMAGAATLDPHLVLDDAFRSIPVLLDGRVTNGQMNQLLEHFKKYLPGKELDISLVTSPQHKLTADETVRGVVKHFESNHFELNPSELKMVVYQVHDKEGKLLGRHFVVLKRIVGDNQIVVVDPNSPKKEFTFQLTEIAGQNSEEPITRISRTDGKPHSIGWVFTMDTLLTVKLKNSRSEN